MTDLPANVYRVKQRDFTAIPREPWVYWISSGVRQAFREHINFGDIADVGQGMTTADNFRFLRGWWELGWDEIGFGFEDTSSANDSRFRWFPYMKGGGSLKWYGYLDLVINWLNDGWEIKSTDRATIRNSHRYFKPGITWSSLSSTGFSARIMPKGFLFDDKGSSCGIDDLRKGYALALFNSSLTTYCLNILNPSVSVQSGDISRLPTISSPVEDLEILEELVARCVRVAYWRNTIKEKTYDFIAPPPWPSGLSSLLTAEAHISELEAQINDEVYHLYGISDADRAAIEAELAGEPLPTDEEEIAAYLDDDDDEKIEAPMDREELAVRWISYAVGVVLGRFRVGAIDETSTDETEIVNRQSKIGNGIYRRADFAVGSLPAPDEAEFNELIGPPERFAYIDETGGRHLFPAEVEASLQDLAVDDGITVLDAGHPRDLPALVERALRLMLGGEAAQEVLTEGAGGDLRTFLEKDYFTQWHIKWYNIPYQAKAPVYWPLQSANRRYGFVLFHEKINKTTLYTLQRDYLDYKINGLKQRIGDLTAALDARQGSQHKRVARQVATLRETLAEVEAFAKTMARIVREGYEPEPNWIDDRIILRMAPLWELIPLWEQYPQKHWQRLQAGEYDWSHIARHYWPARVREACKENKSYAIAHGHPEWYAGE